jgi:cell division protein FtsB
MNRKRKKKKIQEYLSSKVILIILLALLFFLANAAWNMKTKSDSAQQYLDALEDEYKSLDSQYQEVTEELKVIRSGTGIEREIRSKFDLGREGERAIMIIEEEIPEIMEPKEENFWDKIKNWASF